MECEAKQRIISKDVYQKLSIELKEDYGLSPVEVKALTERLKIFIEDLEDNIQGRNQITREVVRQGEPAGKRIKDCKLVSVRLTVGSKADETKDIKIQKRIKMYKIVWEAFEQGGTLSHEDISDILSISISTVKRIVREYKNEGILLPTRGQTEDIGPGLTHKEQIIEMLAKGYLYTDIMNKTGHTEASIENYEKKYLKTIYLNKENKKINTIRMITGYSENLIKSYIKLNEKLEALYPEGIKEMLEKYQSYLEEEKKEASEC